jgi:hypothetical protein
MVFSVTAVDEQGLIREYYGRCDKLEEVVDLIADVITQGCRLLNAHIMDKNSSIPLPLEAFDHQSLSPMLHALEQEWEQILGATK